MSDEATMEIRYTERDDYWTIQKYYVDTAGRVSVDEAMDNAEGKLGKYPAWLKRILDVARVGGHLTRLEQGPPYAILWFKVDKHLNLLEITFP